MMQSLKLTLKTAQCDGCGAAGMETGDSESLGASQMQKNRRIVGNFGSKQAVDCPPLE